jgi:DNA-directed RNA polymerase specialized sigma24 family protein
MKISSIEGMVLDSEKLAEKMSNVSYFSKRQAEIYVLRNNVGLSVEEVAEELDLSPGTVSKYSERYREKIKMAEATISLKDKWS